MSALETVRIYAVTLDECTLLQHDLHLFLDTTELARARAFRFDHVRHTFVTCRGLLRAILAAELALPSPSFVEFSYGPHGKPRLAPHFPPLPFNVTHTSGIALIALGQQSELGVDVEFHRPISDLHRLVERFFTPRESAEITAKTGSAKIEAFYYFWTRKESVLKASGKGLALPLDAFDVSSTPAIVRGSHQMARTSSYFLHSFSPTRGFTAALATSETESEFSLIGLKSPAELVQFLSQSTPHTRFRR